MNLQCQRGEIMKEGTCLSRENARFPLIYFV
jgi:hypothetical protein